MKLLVLSTLLATSIASTILTNGPGVNSAGASPAASDSICDYLPKWPGCP